MSSRITGPSSPRSRVGAAAAASDSSRLRCRCLTCRTLIAAGSYCPPHKPRPESRGRHKGRRCQDIRADVVHSHSGRCARCGATDVPLEIHHRDHDHRNSTPGNLAALCRSCHAKVGIQT